MTLMLLLALACSPAKDDTGRPHADTDADADADTDTDTDTDADADTDADTDADAIEPPLGGTSGGSGGADYPSSTHISGDPDYYLLAPNGSSSGTSLCFLLVISGTEGSSRMMGNMTQVAPYYDLDDCLIAVLDGTRADAEEAAATLDEVRAAYDVDNDRTWLMSESAGTREGLKLGFDLRQSYFAAYWANDVNARDTPTLTAAQLGFTPWGNAGPGGDYADASSIVEGMDGAGYHLPADAPYSGEGSDSHGSTEQFLAAVDFFANKSRR